MTRIPTQAEVEAAAVEYDRWTFGSDIMNTQEHRYEVIRLDGDAYDQISFHHCLKDAENTCRREALEAALVAAEAVRPTRPPQDAWQPIETAPRDGRLILVARDMREPWGWVRGVSRWDGARGIYGWISQGISDPPGNLGLGHPTHWMPLPAAPPVIRKLPIGDDGGRDG